MPVQFCTPAEVAQTGYSGSGGTPAPDTALCQRASDVLLQAARNDLLIPDFAIVTDWPTVTATTKYVNGYGELLPLEPYLAGSVTGVVDSDSVTINPATYTEAMPWALRKVGDPWASTADSWDGRYAVTAKWGISLTDSLKQVAIELVVNIHKSAKNGQFTDMLGVNDGGKVALFGRVDSLQKAIIENFVQQIRRLARYE
jgi:hypothetical protein